MKKFTFTSVLLLFQCFISFVSFAQFSLKDVKSYAFPSELVVSPKGDQIALAMNEEGVRNIYVGEAPTYKLRKLTNFQVDNGQEISSISISSNGKWVVFVLGGEHGGNWDNSKPVNTNSSQLPLKVRVCQISFDGGPIKYISEGDYPTISSAGEVVAFLKDDQPWVCHLDSMKEDDFLEIPRQLVQTRGKVSDLQWSPVNNQIAFTVDRGNYSFIGYTQVGKELESETVKWVSPGFYNDVSPRWSPNGNQIAFVRTPSNGGETDSLSIRKPTFWSIQVSDLSGKGSKLVWESPKNNRGTLPPTDGHANLMFSSNEIINFTSYQDGWPHLYSVSSKGGKATCLTPGNFMIEHLSLNKNLKQITFDGNFGSDPLDFHRRHLGVVSIDKADMKILTSGEGNEWKGMFAAGADDLFYLGATAQKGPQLYLKKVNQSSQSLSGNLYPTKFPEKQLYTPKSVEFKSLDGLTIYGQVFDNGDGKSNKPAVVFVHGGPSRQMLLGWHYSDYYANAYAMNQYLAQQGFVVLSVNYRLGIGYGFEFQHPSNFLAAPEYWDVKAAGEWLAKQSNVNPKKIGLWGGSYGGYLTAMGLGKDSKLFTAGVDIHGVHDWLMYHQNELFGATNKRAPDADWAANLIAKGSPISYVNTWTSPVLFIHGDDDRNVAFQQSIDLIKRLEKKKVKMESMVIVDDNHHWSKHENAITVLEATAEFLKNQLMK
ncbi:MAG: hypothetical protein RI995_1156 [Bacteroidota bacterium]